MRHFAASLLLLLVLVLPRPDGASAAGMLPGEGTDGAGAVVFSAPNTSAPGAPFLHSPSVVGPEAAGAPAGLIAGSVADAGAVADSADLLREVQRAQANFERFRVQRLPTTWASGGGRCDEWVGRFCLRYGPEVDDEDAPPAWRPPPDPPEVVERRDELVHRLGDVAREIPGDRWVAGQRVAYLLEVEDPEAALEAARECRATEPGWCRALEGLALYRLARIEEAEAAFDAALEAMDPEDREEWLDLDPVVDQETRRALSRMSGEEREEVEAWFWALADPLLLVPGNELRAEHLARHTLARTREDARNPHGIRWSSDMTRILVRFGPQIGYQRIQERPSVYMGPPPLLGRFSTEARQLVPAHDGLLETATAEADDFDTRRRRARARHEPVTSPRIGRMEVQLARFRDGDSVRVVGGWRSVPLPEREEGRGEPQPVAASEEAEAGGSVGGTGDGAGDGAGQDGVGMRQVRGGFFAFTEVDGEGTPSGRQVGVLEPGYGAPGGGGGEAGDGGAAGGETAREGWLDGRLGTGSHLVSLELLDEETRDAWRHRTPLGLEPRPRGVVEISDLLLVRPGSEARVGGHREPEDLDGFVRRVLPGTVVAPGPVEVVWEIYGFEPGEAAWRFSLTARPSDRGRLRRLGDRIGLTSAPDGLSLSWEEGEELERDPDTGEAVGLLRSAVLDLSALEPGGWELVVAVELPGRTPATSVREVTVVEGRGTR